MDYRLLRRNGPLFGFLFSVMLVHTGCTRKKDAAVKGVMEVEGAWGHRELKVCFAEGNGAQALADTLFRNESVKVKPEGFNAQQKKLIQDAVESEYTMEATGVRFSGFSVCPQGTAQSSPGETSGTQTNLVLFHAQAPEKGAKNTTSGFGQSKQVETGFGDFGFKRDETVRTLGIAMELDRFCGNTTPPFLWKVSPDVCSRLTVLHEFGHALGLRHEQAHPEAPQDPLCQVDLKTGAPPTDGWVSDELEVLGDTAQTMTYDPGSIMNYCHTFAFLRGDERSQIKEPKLSDGDKASLKSVYGAKGRGAESKP